MFQGMELVRTLQCPIKHGQSGFAQGIPHPCTCNQSTNVRVILRSRILGKGASYEADDVRLRHTLNRIVLVVPVLPQVAMMDTNWDRQGSATLHCAIVIHILTSPEFPRGEPEGPSVQAEKTLCIVKAKSVPESHKSSRVAHLYWLLWLAAELQEPTSALNDEC
ncbi:unnamed protein product [Fusarium venenatum]|uniref:Uncharacterized protein n=1 Tax=Fusarium venenatum TaxID=56646 RepID=A0A2L2T1C6_9HYPO|nr:uncharacterized protein FVRRES_00884 [Fusarium venenatum]CEI64372.1 unnamed protein product [Fusarium venenatum]